MTAFQEDTVLVSETPAFYAELYYVFKLGKVVYQRLHKEFRGTSYKKIIHMAKDSLWNDLHQLTNILSNFRQIVTCFSLTIQQGIQYY